eukprot:TRINITY_DN67290_c3_g1_i1.p1 TRINITY_DN67290_c3_g1~~TRINITY_DN67290_c3_g1_i1.p1  ORF type:complete len:736 (-),score=344.09 TRINITY_DN67290_c3_g1_i1:38-1987(-)
MATAGAIGGEVVRARQSWQFVGAVFCMRGGGVPGVLLLYLHTAVFVPCVVKQHEQQQLQHDDSGAGDDDDEEEPGLVSKRRANAVDEEDPEQEESLEIAFPTVQSVQVRSVSSGTSHMLSVVYRVDEQRLATERFWGMESPEAAFIDIIALITDSIVGSPSPRIQQDHHGNDHDDKEEERDDRADDADGSDVKQLRQQEQRAQHEELGRHARFAPGAAAGVEVYENERWVVGLGWSSAFLLPSDPPRWLCVMSPEQARLDNVSIRVEAQHIERERQRRLARQRQLERNKQGDVVGELGAFHVVDDGDGEQDDDDYAGGDFYQAPNVLGGEQSDEQPRDGDRKDDDEDGKQKKQQRHLSQRKMWSIEDISRALRPGWLWVSQWDVYRGCIGIVESVASGSPAEHAGIEDGDVLLRFQTQADVLHGGYAQRQRTLHERHRQRSGDDNELQSKKREQRQKAQQQRQQERLKIDSNILGMYTQLCMPQKQTHRQFASVLRDNIGAPVAVTLYRPTTNEYLVVFPVPRIRAQQPWLGCRFSQQFGSATIDGWEYAASFQSEFSTATSQSQFVRRRKWVRHAAFFSKDGDDATTHDSGDQGWPLRPVPTLSRMTEDRAARAHYSLDSSRAFYWGLNIDYRAGLEWISDYHRWFHY